MRVISYFLFLFVILLPSLSLGTPLSLKIFLELYPDLNLLKGEIFTKLDFNENYNFKTSGLTIKEIKTSANLIFEEDVLKVSNLEKGTYLSIFFEKPINIWILPITIIDFPFPSPDKPFVYEITIKLPKTFKNLEILIPYEENEVEEDEEHIFYTFKNSKPVLKPCIVVSTFQLEKAEFLYKNVEFRFFWLLQTDNVNFEELKKFFDKFKTLANILENTGKPLYPFRTVYVIIVPENFTAKEDVSHILFVNSSILENLNPFLHLLAKKKIEEGLFLENEELKEGLITYLIDYQLTENKKSFRKMHLAFPKNESKAFFYILNLSKILGEKRFLNLFKKFYENNLFQPKTWNNFLDLIKQNYPNLTESIISYSDFPKLNLESKINSLEKRGDSYLIKLSIYVNPKPENFIKSIPLCIKIETEKNSEVFNFMLNNKTQDFSIFVREKPKSISIDPEYLLWRNLNFNETPNSIAKLFQYPGVLIVDNDVFPIYKDLINYFINLGYRVSDSFIDPSNSSINFQNLIYLDKSPLPWQFNPPSKGFYLKVIPNPYNLQYTIGFIYTSSKDEIDLSKLSPFYNYSEVVIESKKIIFRKEDKTLEGITLFIPDSFLSFYLKNNFCPKKRAIDLINTQVILIGTEDNIPFFNEFFEYFFQNIFNLNSNIALALDLPPHFQKVLEKYFHNKISESKFMEHLKGIGYEGLDNSIVLNLIRWAKINDVKVFSIGIDPELFFKVLRNGLESLSEKELSKLPEIDFLNPSYKDYLNSLFESSKKFQEVKFENFYQAQIVKIETLAENIKNLLKILKSYQIITITKKDLIMHKWGLSQYLQKRNIQNFKTIILTSEKIEFSN